MKLQCDKEKEILKNKYPEGSKEREILDYSSSTHINEEVPAPLVAVFKVLMGVSAIMAAAAAFAYFSYTSH